MRASGSPSDSLLSRVCDCPSVNTVIRGVI
jgi:hypothetical protein